MIGHELFPSSLALLAQVAQPAQRVAASTLYPSWCPAWAFWILSLLTVTGAVVTITRRNLIGAVMALVATFFGLASMYALLMAHFLAAIQVLVYAGAIMVLFVFVIMVLNHDEAEPWALKRPIMTALGAGGLVYFGVLLVEVLLSRRPPGSARAGIPSESFGSVSGIGEYFFKDFVFPFEAISILLVIAVIGAVVLARTIAKPTSVHELPESERPPVINESDSDGTADAHDGHAAHGGH